MENTLDSGTFTATVVRIALGEVCPESTYGALPAQDRYDAVEAYRLYEDGGLEAAPQALAAYVDIHQRQWM